MEKKEMGPGKLTKHALAIASECYEVNLSAIGDKRAISARVTVLQFLWKRGIPVSYLADLLGLTNSTISAAIHTQKHYEEYEPERSKTLIKLNEL